MGIHLLDIQSECYKFNCDRTMIKCFNNFQQEVEETVRYLEDSSDYLT